VGPSPDSLGDDGVLPTEAMEMILRLPGRNVEVPSESIEMNAGVVPDVFAHLLTNVGHVR
jgi:hypothetical protein